MGIKDQIIQMYRDGVSTRIIHDTIRDMPDTKGMPRGAVEKTIDGLIDIGILMPRDHERASACDYRRHLSDKERIWMRSQIPEGSTEGELIAAIIRDAYLDEL